MMKPEEVYQQKKDRLLWFLRTQDFNRDFPGQFGETIRRSTDIVLRDLDALVGGSEATPTTEEAGVVGRSIHMVMDAVTYQPLNRFMADFIQLYLEVVKNWNLQTVRARDIDEMVDVSTRLVSGYLTVVDATTVLRRVTARLEHIMRYTPPSFELSRHYLSAVLEKYRKQEPINKYDCAKMRSDNQKCKEQDQKCEKEKSGAEGKGSAR